MLSEDAISTILTLLDQAINAPDLESLKRGLPYDVKDEKQYSNCYLANERTRGYNEAIDHLAPRIVLATEAEQLRKERDELAKALVWYDTAIQEVPELTVHHNKDMIEAIDKAKRIIENGNA
jgi:hypothetical protein